MKKTIFFVCLMIISLGTTTAFANNSKPKFATETPAIPDKKADKLSEEEMSRLKNRVEEIRDMDKTNMTFKEKRELRKELRTIKETVRRDGGYVYIGGSTLLLIIILILIL